MSNNDREDPPIHGGRWIALGAVAFMALFTWAFFYPLFS
jgi:hypothetical protein